MVTQNHWLQNQSVKDNILFGKAFQKDLYDKVLRLCQLQDDLLTFKNRD